MRKLKNNRTSRQDIKQREKAINLHMSENFSIFARKFACDV